MLLANFKLLAASLSQRMAQNTGLPPYLKVIGGNRNERVVVVDSRRRVPATSMIVFPGYIIPACAEERRIEPSEMTKAAIKISSAKGNNDHLLLEGEILVCLEGTGGIPKLLDKGSVSVEYLEGKAEPVIAERPYFVMPWMPGEELDKFSLPDWDEERPTREQIARMVSVALPALAEVLAQIHGRGVVHRDVKPNNILFDPGCGRLTLLDFGRANWLNAPPRSDLGVLGFFPPELAFEKPEVEDVRTDTYALGATAFAVLSGRERLLYEGMEDPALYAFPDFMFMDRNELVRRYYNAIRQLASLRLSVDGLVARSNMPADLKETAIARYIAELLHPDREKRPTDMRLVAETIRRLGGQLLEHEVGSA